MNVDLHVADHRGDDRGQCHQEDPAAPAAGFQRASIGSGSGATKWRLKILYVTRTLTGAMSCVSSTRLHAAGYRRFSGARQMLGADVCLRGRRQEALILMGVWCGALPVASAHKTPVAIPLHPLFKNP